MSPIAFTATMATVAVSCFALGYWLGALWDEAMAMLAGYATAYAAMWTVQYQLVGIKDEVGTLMGDRA